MEIERKWLVEGWPAGLPLVEEYTMRQGYISVRPTVRIREEAKTGGPTAWVLCFKSAGGLAREEIELEITPEQFERLKALIGLPLIAKEQRRYALADGLELEVNWVDRGQPGAFFYAEVEFPTREAALSWEAGAWSPYLEREVTGQPGQSMADYWRATRGDPGEEASLQGDG